MSDGKSTRNTYFFFPQDMKPELSHKIIPNSHCGGGEKKQTKTERDNGQIQKNLKMTEHCNVWQ